MSLAAYFPEIPQLHVVTCLLYRWRSIDTLQIYAVKKISKARLDADFCLYENEVTGLQHAKKCKVPRVVELHEVLRADNGDVYLVLE